MLYLHIPYCKQACSYCNFHFSTRLDGRAEMVDAICRELALRRGELPPGPVASVYFGGGTPSLLTAAELDRLFATLYEFDYLMEEGGGAAGAEITLEANPDDLDAATLAALAASPVNRLSIGIQSFAEADLRFMNRAHSAPEAHAAVGRATAAGFRDLSIDLIYGGQTTTDAVWRQNLATATDLGVNHISAYALTVEPRTALAHRVASGAVPDVSDARFARQFDLMVDWLTTHGYEHYEISNFCRPGHASRHNSGYWTGRPYLGVGPGAHSFDGHRRRRWNVSNNARYRRALAEIHTPADHAAAFGLLFGEETLSDTDAYHEFILTGLRRRAGVTLAELRRRFGPGPAAHFARSQAANLAAGYFDAAAVAAGGTYRLTPAGIRLADGVIADGFFP